jgi:hypothetical protein
MNPCWSLLALLSYIHGAHSTNDRDGNTLTIALSSGKQRWAIRRDRHQRKELPFEMSSADALCAVASTTSIAPVKREGQALLAILWFPLILFYFVHLFRYVLTSLATEAGAFVFSFRRRGMKFATKNLQSCEARRMSSRGVMRRPPWCSSSLRYRRVWRRARGRGTSRYNLRRSQPMPPPHEAPAAADWQCRTDAAAACAGCPLVS